MATNNVVPFSVERGPAGDSSGILRQTTNYIIERVNERPRKPRGIHTVAQKQLPVYTQALNLALNDPTRPGAHNYLPMHAHDVFGPNVDVNQLL